ncbi:hypothetical protein JCM5353_004263 [Sporobolomyces roseus]
MASSAPPDYAIQFSGSLVQCEPTLLTWKGNSPDPKIIKAFITGENYFFETLTPSPLTGSLGSIEYLVDVASGLSIQFQLYNSATPPSNLTYAVTSASGALVQPGKKDGCLRKNRGQEAEESMRRMAREMSLRSPQLFTGYTTTSSSSATSIISTPSLTSAPPTSTPIPSSSPSPSSRSPSTAILAGSIAGGVIGVFLSLSLIIYFCRRNKLRTQNSLPSSSSTITGRGGGLPRSNTLTTEAARVSRIDHWRSLIFPSPSSSSERPLSRITTRTQTQAASIPIIQQSGGYRKGIPEVGERDDRDLYEGSVPVRAGRGQGGRRFSLFSRSEKGGGGGEVERMRTPGVMTEKGEDEEEEEERTYESYSR